MTSKDEYKKLTLHVSAELLEQLDDASSRLKLSKGSLIRKALEEFISKSRKGYV